MDNYKVPMTKIKPPKKKKYLTNKELLAEIVNSHAKGEMTPLLAEMIMKLCSRYAKKSEYANYSYNDDMQSFALLTVVKVWKSFDPAKSQNPFAYFTQTIKHSFYQYLNSEKKQRNIRDELLLSNGDNPSFNYNGDGSDESYGGFDYNVHINYNAYNEDEEKSET